MEKTNRLVLVSGPSGVGKGPIIEWVKKLYLPELYQVDVKKTKTERHKGNEKELGFDGLSGNRLEFKCRGVYQAIDLDELDNALEENAVVLIESYYVAHGTLKCRYSNKVDFRSVFVSPISNEEIDELSDQNKRLDRYLPNLMLDSLVRRAYRDGKSMTRNLMADLEVRAVDSLNEMAYSDNYGEKIVNHCYEADPRWYFDAIVGEPLSVVRKLRDLISN